MFKFYLLYICHFQTILAYIKFNLKLYCFYICINIQILY